MIQMLSYIFLQALGYTIIKNYLLNMSFVASFFLANSNNNEQLLLTY